MADFTMTSNEGITLGQLHKKFATCYFVCDGELHVIFEWADVDEPDPAGYVTALNLSTEQLVHLDPDLEVIQVSVEIHATELPCK